MQIPFKHSCGIAARDEQDVTQHFDLVAFAYSEHRGKRHLVNSRNEPDTVCVTDGFLQQLDLSTFSSPPLIQAGCK